MRTTISRNRDGLVFRNVPTVLALGLILALAQSAPGASGGAPTRAEILKGGLGPMRTCFDVTSYHLDVRIDPATKSISGSNKITFKTVDDFTKMQVDLWSNLDISKITLDDQAEAKYTRELGAVFVELPETVKAGSTHSVTVFYSGIPVVARRPPWNGGITWDHDSEGYPWVVVTCEGDGASIWWPNKEIASDRADNVTISITTPPGLEDVSNGRLKARTVLPDGWVRYDWYVSYPIDNYCVTFNIGKFAHFNDDYVSKDGQKLTLDYYVMPENLAKAKEQFKQVKKMLSSFEKYFGDYPFPRDGYKLVESPHTGMEHQSCVAYGNHYANGYRGRASSDVGMKFDFIIVHESAHEWWGNNVTCSDVADEWIHESFGAYAESLFVEDQYGHAEALRYINDKKPNVRNLRPIIGEYGLYREGDGDMYDKGQLVLNTLRSVVDDDKLWISILRGLQETFAHKAVSASDVFGYINKRSGKDLNYFYDQYFKHAAIPTLSVQAQKIGDNATVAYRWTTDVPNFRMPVKVTLAPGKYDWITPTTEWQTNKLNGVAPEDFKMADDLFYANMRLRWTYLVSERQTER